MKKRVWCLILAICMVMMAASCGGGGGTETEAASGGASGESAQEAGGSTKDTLVLANSADVTSFDPFVDTNGVSGRVRSCIYESLWIQENDGGYTPLLATEWEWTDDLHLSITLREGVTFSNGNPFTADDVLFTYESALNGAFPQYFSKIEQINVVDDTHVEFVFSQVDATIMAYIASFFPILDRETVEANPEALATTPIGTGPYVLENWSVGDSQTLKRNENYWGEPAKIENVTFRVVTEPTQRYVELMTGGVDFAFELAYADAMSMDASQFTISQDLNTVVNHLMINSDEGHKMADENLRIAMAYCIDREALVQAAYAGSALPAWSPVSPSTSGYYEELEGYEPYPQDFEKAKEYLAAAGYADGVTLNLLYTGDNQYYSNMVEVLQNWFGQAGIELNLNSSDFNTALTYAIDRTNDWDLYIIGNGAATAAITMSWWDRNQGAPFAIFQDEGIFSLLDQVYVTNDEAAQKELLDEAQQYMIDHVGSYPLSIQYVCQGGVSNLKGINVRLAQQRIDVEDLYFE